MSCMLNIFPGCTFGLSSNLARWLRSLSPTGGNVGGFTDICLHHWTLVVMSWPSCLPQEKKQSETEAQPGGSAAHFLSAGRGWVKERMWRMRGDLLKVWFIQRHVSLSLRVMITWMELADWNHNSASLSFWINHLLWSTWGNLRRLKNEFRQIDSVFNPPNPLTCQ